MSASGTVLAHDNSDQRWPPASVTKVMTAYLTFKALKSGQLTLTSPVVMSANAAKEPPSKMGYKPGTVVTVDNALKMMLVRSANDIAIALAETVGGSEANFVQLMNAQAQGAGDERHPLPQSQRPARRRPVFDGARPCGPCPRHLDGVPAIPRLFRHPGHPAPATRSCATTTS